MQTAHRGLSALARHPARHSPAACLSLQSPSLAAALEKHGGEAHHPLQRAPQVALPRRDRVGPNPAPPPVAEGARDPGPGDRGRPTPARIEPLRGGTPGLALEALPGKRAPRPSVASQSVGTSPGHGLSYAPASEALRQARAGKPNASRRRIGHGTSSARTPREPG